MSQEPILAKILRWGIYALAFLPLIIFNDFLSPFHFGKVVVFRSIVEVLAVLFLILVIRDKSFRLKPTPLFWSITVFTLAFGLATLTSVSKLPSFWGSLERMGGWYSFIHFWIFFVIMDSVFYKKEHWLRLINIVLLVGLLSAFYGFFQKSSIKWFIGSGGRTKIFGTIGNPALFAGYIIFSAFISAAMFSLSKAWNWAKFFYLIVFISSGIAVLLSGVRGSVLAMIVGILLFGFLYARAFDSKRIKKYTVIFLVVLISTAAILVSLKNTDFVKNSQYLTRYADISPTTYTVNTRLWAWQAGLQGLADSFKTILVGYGPENFNIPFSKHFNPKFFRGIGSETLFDRAHNQFVEILVTMGFLGFIAYLGIYFYAFSALKSLRIKAGRENSELRILSLGLWVTLIAYIIHNSFIFDTSANFLLFFTVLGFINYLIKANISSQTSPEPIKKIISETSLVLPSMVGIVGLIFALFLIYQTNIVPAKANYTTTRGVVSTWAKNHDGAVSFFKKALTYETFGKYEIRHRHAQYLLEYSNSRVIDEKLKDELLFVIESVKKNIAEFPHDYLPHLYISRAYILLGKNDPSSPYNDLALENARQAQKISPTFIRTYFELAQAYLNKKDYAKAAAEFKKAVELNPDVGISWWYLGVTQFELENRTEALNSLEKAFLATNAYDANVDDLNRMLNIYIGVGDLNKIAKIYVRLTELDPNNAQYHASLAATYSQLGKIDEAVLQAKAASDIDSSFEPDARAFVKSLGRAWPSILDLPR